MTEAQVFEKIGRLQVQYDELLANYQTLVEINRGIKAGTISLDRLTIEDNGIWTLAPAVANPEEQAS